MLPILVLLAACAEPSLQPDRGLLDHDPADDTGDEAEDPVVLPDEDCVEDEASFGRIEAMPVEGQMTVLRVRWDGPARQRPRVHFEDALGQARTVPADLERGTLLVGSRADEDVRVQLSADLDGERVCSREVRAHTGDLPAGLPEAELTGSLGGPATPAFLALPVLSELARRAMVFETRTGAPVWHWTIPGALVGGSPMYRVHVREDGGGVLVNIHSAPGDPGGVYRVDWDGTWTFSEVPGASRDFTVLADGTVAVLATELRLAQDGTTVEGDRLFELSPAGDLVEIWNMFEDYPHAWGETVPTQVLDPEFVEWAHANGLDHDAARDQYVISLPDLDSGVVARVDRRSGDLVWTLQDRGGDFEVAGLNQPVVELPHSVQVLPEDHLLLFNRRGPQACSGALELALDPARGVATAVWEHETEDCLLVTFLGEAHRLPDGDTVVAWSSGGRVDIVDPAGALRWRLALDLGAGFGFVDHAAALGTRVP